jgi:SAM-dependent methyltransferase
MMQYDLGLFEELNEAYRDKPIWRPPTSASERPKAAELVDRARAETERRETEKKLRPILASVELSGRTVLELGCGHGFLTATLPGAAGVRHAIGVDIRPYSSWAEHEERDDVSFIVGDLSSEPLLPPESVDVVISTVVLEHVTRPITMLSAIRDVMRTEGKAWLFFNLYRGRNASHCYREVFFPWPHLLFDDAVCHAFYEKHHGRKLRFSWVNRMTIAEYLVVSRDAGFEIVNVKLERTPVDLDFYLRFEDKLGRYPALDLETNFMTLILEKSLSPTGHVPSVGYQEAQTELDRRIGDHRGAAAPADESAPGAVSVRSEGAQSSAPAILGGTTRAQRHDG